MRKALCDNRETTRRQRGHGKTKDIIGRTIAQHVRLYISEPYNAKQQCEIPTICVVCEPKPRRQIILISIWNLELNASLIPNAEVEVWRRMRQ